jgi:hypothetical protein
MSAMKYVVLDAEGQTVSIVDADSLGEAVEIKHFLEREYGRRENADCIFTVKLATRKEIRAFEP